MTDCRNALPPGTVLRFEGITCTLDGEVGRGSNTLVYRGSYRDASSREQAHRILVKELFPFHPKGKIFREADGSVRVDPEGEDTFALHRRSFEEGNRVHLALLEKHPEQIGTNLNTFALNNTLYTILGVSGGTTLDRREPGAAVSLRLCAERMLLLLDALEVFHENGLVHLDISPDNILLLGEKSRERVLLIDYNSSLRIGGIYRPEALPAFSVKAGYTAPEIRMGNYSQISYASDLYSVAAVFFRLLTGTPLTSFQMIRSSPPDVTGAPCVLREPETVRSWVQVILRRGLKTLPGRRYPDIASMRKDIEELIDRIDGVGITKWALWEAGHRLAEHTVRDNPSLAFIRDHSRLYPSLVSDNGRLYQADEYFREAAENCVLVAAAGMGKTTALLHLAFREENRDPESDPAVMYLSLYGWRHEEDSFILNRILEELRFRPETHTYADARNALRTLLGKGKEKTDKPVLLLLLDGINEVRRNADMLAEEIRGLSGLPGLRMVVAGRTEEDALPFRRVDLAEMTDEAVRQILGREGLLLPESEEVRRQLHTPMMLSMYVSAGTDEKKQVNVATAEELMQAYLTALREKALRDLPDEQDSRWQIEAAIDLALPAIASEISKRDHALDNRELFPTVDKCFRLLKGRISRRFFPQWIGHFSSVRGKAADSEEWYGRIVHEILWKRLGLLIRDPLGHFNISHQVIREYLVGRDRDNQRKIRLYRGLRTALACVTVCLALGAGFVMFRSLLSPAPSPTPYEESYADSVMNRALDGYVAAGMQYEALASLNESALSSPDSFSEALTAYRRRTPYGSMSSERSLAFLAEMIETGSVMPWSGIPMNSDACRELMMLAESRAEEYARFAEVLEFVMTDDFAYRHYSSEYPELLSALLETDADIAGALFRIVLSPHITGKYADGTAEAAVFEDVFGSIPGQNAHLTDETPEDAGQTLARLKGQRRKNLENLYQCGAFHAFESSRD